MALSVLESPLYPPLACWREIWWFGIQRRFSRRRKLNKRLKTSVVVGALLGVFCIIGGSVRAGGLAGNELYLLALWYNRVIIGLTIGLAGQWRLVNGARNRYIRGALLGFLVSSAFFLSTEMRDTIAFFAGIVYGVIIEYVAQRYD
jgi:hypothetical protein